MSDRLSLFPDRAAWAEVSLADHPTMADAIRAFANWAQVLKVIGPKEKLEECYLEWLRIEATEPHSIPPTESVAWFQKERFESVPPWRESAVRWEPAEKPAGGEGA